MIEDVIRQIQDEEIVRFAYKGDVSICERQTGHSFSGQIHLLTTPRIEIEYRNDYPERAKSLEKIVSNPFAAAFRALIRHELNHKGGGKYKGCPRTIDLHAEAILEPTAVTLREQGFPRVLVNDHQTIDAYFANLVEDVVDNFEQARSCDYVGMALMYKDDAMTLATHKFSPLFDAFVQLQERMFGGKRSRQLLQEHYGGDARVDEAVVNVLERTGLAKHKRVTRKGKIVADNRKMLAYCLDEKNWSSISRIITEEFSKLVDKDKLQQPEYVRAMFLPLKGEGDVFGDEMSDPETLMKFVWKKYQKCGEEGVPFEPPAYLDKNAALDLVYQRLARNLEIKTRASTSSTSMPVMWHGKRLFDPSRDKPSQARVKFGSGGRLELSVKRFHEDLPFEYTQSQGSIPSIRFIKRDDSGSMRSPVEGNGIGRIMNPWAPEPQQWGGNSRYHHLLVAEWSLYEFLRKQGTLKHTGIKSVSYSHTTRVARNLAESKAQALSPTFGCETVMDMDTINQLFGRDELVLSISDGEVQNWNSWLIEPEVARDGIVIKPGIKVSDEYIKRAKQNHYVHFQIGAPTTMSKELESAGLCVHHDNGKNLGRLVIDVTRPYVTRGAQK